MTYTFELIVMFKSFASLSRVMGKFCLAWSLPGIQSRDFALTPNLPRLFRFYKNIHYLSQASSSVGVFDLLWSFFFSILLFINAIFIINFSISLQLLLYTQFLWWISDKSSIDIHASNITLEKSSPVIQSITFSQLDSNIGKYRSSKYPECRTNHNAVSSNCSRFTY